MIAPVVFLGEFWQVVGWRRLVGNSFLPQTSQILCQRIIAEIMKRLVRWGMSPACVGDLCFATLNLSTEGMSEICSKPQIERRENGELECRSLWTQKEVWEKSTPEYFILLADTPLWEKVLFINRIFSKPRCHTEKHTLNKMPFLTSLLFPPLPFGRRKGSIYNIETSAENYRWALVSAEMEKCHLEGCDKLQRGLFWKAGVFFKIAIPCQRIFYMQRGYNTNAHATVGMPTVR